MSATTVFYATVVAVFVQFCLASCQPIAENPVDSCYEFVRESPVTPSSVYNVEYGSKDSQMSKLGRKDVAKLSFEIPHMPA